MLFKCVLCVTVTNKQVREKNYIEFNIWILSVSVYLLLALAHFLQGLRGDQYMFPFVSLVHPSTYKCTTQK